MCDLLALLIGGPKTREAYREHTRAIQRLAYERRLLNQQLRNQ